MKFVIDNTPGGFVKIENKKIVQPTRKEMKKSMEGLIHHFKVFTYGIVVKRSEIYISTEAPKGEFGVFVGSEGLNKPYRFKLRAPGFYHLQGLKLFTGEMLADIITLIGTMDIVFGEVDR